MKKINHALCLVCFVAANCYAEEIQWSMSLDELDLKLNASASNMKFAPWQLADIESDRQVSVQISEQTAMLDQRLDDLKNQIRQSSLHMSSLSTAIRKFLVSTLMPVDLNKADIPHLMRLPNVNEQIAKNIITKRNSIGKFDNVEQLLKVNGVTTAVFNSARQYLYVE